MPPELRGVPQGYVRRCAATIARVLAATVPQPTGAAADEPAARLQAAR
jgi:hypothetical protein